ncbi:MAG TPA: hypothetical protein VNK23_04110 [Candidatus Dormibacteraeota bacterium]|nr:hypothetical protein [Candidatus Dormibacteraeota bacterium]
MHPYSTNSEERTTLPFVLAVISIGLAWLLSSIIGKAHLPFWLEVPGTFTLYSILLWAFRSYWWKWRWLHRVGIIKVPDISGDWSGYVTSSFDRLAQHHPVQVRIRQNWTHLMVQLSADQSWSDSIVASIAVGEETVVSYQYTNRPKPGAKDTMHAHMGTASLKLSDDHSELSGEYYSGRDRANQGITVLTNNRDYAGLAIIAMRDGRNGP